MVDLDADAHQYRLDQVKELEADIARLKENCYEQYKRINELEEALREIAQPQCNGAAGPDLRTCIIIASTALAGNKQ